MAGTLLMNLLRAGALAVALHVPAAGAASIVANGSFETFTGPANNQQLTNSNATPWTTTSGATSIITLSQAVNGFAEGVGNAVSFWRAGNGGSGTITASPDGGNFLASDGPYLSGATSQVLVGLVSGATYQVSFYQGAAQQYGYGDTTTWTSDYWQVSLGASTQNSATMNVAPRSFYGWVQQQLLFTATATTMTLSFLAKGAPGAQPPYALLDGVAVTQMPEPATGLLVLAGMLGLAGARRYASAARR